jgi:membrane protease YdiL (CAAX protease family)
MAKVFGAKKLTVSEADALARQIEPKGFVSRLALVHASEKAGQGPAKRDALLPPAKTVTKGIAISVVVFAVAFGLLIWIGFAAAKLNGSLPIKEFPTGSLTLGRADALAMRAAQIFVIFIGVQLLGEIAQTSAPDAGKTIITFLVGCSLIFLPIWLFRLPVLGRTITLRQIGIHGDNLGKNVAWGIGCAFANLPIVFFMAFIGTSLFAGLPPAEHPITNQIKDGVDWFGLGVILFTGSIAAPILEEIMFRATLLPAMARVWARPVLAILAQGLLFAMIHPTGIPAWLPLATIGAMSGFLARQTGSLVPCIVMHAVHNLGTLLFAMAILT